MPASHYNYYTLFIFRIALKVLYTTSTSGEKKKEKSTSKESEKEIKKKK